MSTLGRLRDTLRANLNAWMDRAAAGEDRAKALAAAEEAVALARRAIRDAVVEVSALEREVAARRDEAAREERAAIEALRAADEARARRHLARKLDLEREADHLSRLAEQERVHLGEMKADLGRFQAVLDSARARVATGASAGFEWADEWAERIERLDAEAEALRELERELRGPGAREAPAVEDQLRHLKEQLDRDEPEKK